MDCEKFESVMMDELYGELDELTSAAARRHIEGCARCAVLIGGLRATRRVAALPWVEPPAGLEPRILAAAAAATPKVMPFRGRLARGVSLAGRWAMRPQTAMAAVFLVMIGTSVLLLRGKSSRAPASTYVTVTEEGAPAPAAMPSAAGDTPVAAPAPEPASPPPVAGGAVARSQEHAAPPSVWAQPPNDDPSPEGRARSAPKTSAAKPDDGLHAVAQNAGPRSMSGAGIEPPFPVRAAAPGAAPVNASPPQDYAAAPPAEAEMAPAAAAAPVDPSDELSAARTARDTAARLGKTCPSGPRFDDVASRVPGSQAGWDALYEGALCYESAHEYGSARTRLGTLLGVPSYRDRARYTIDRINKEQSGGAAAAARAAAKAAADAAAALADAGSDASR